MGTSSLAIGRSPMPQKRAPAGVRSKRPLQYTAVIALFTLASCGMGVGLPTNKAFFHIQNSTNQELRLLLEDTPRSLSRDGVPVQVTRVYDRGVIAPGGKQFFQWPFAAETGRVLAVVGSDTTRSPWILPWSKKTWRWSIQSGTFVVTTEDR